MKTRFAAWWLCLAVFATRGVLVAQNAAPAGDPLRSGESTYTSIGAAHPGESLEEVLGGGLVGKLPGGAATMVVPFPDAIADTLSIDPEGTHPGGGWDSIPADPSRSGGYNVGLGFTFQVANSLNLAAAKFLLRQTEIGGGLIGRLYQARGGADPSASSYWLPLYGAQILATLTLDSPFPLPDTVWTQVTFRLDTPYTLAANTPYVIVFDPLPTDGRKDTW